MAARLKPSAGGKPDKLFRDAIMLEVSRRAADGKTKLINAIAAKVVSKAESGDLMAAQMVRDSIDGKPAQAIAVSGDGEGGPIQIGWKTGE